MPHEGVALALRPSLSSWQGWQAVIHKPCMQVAAHQHALAHALPHAYYAANPQAFPEGTLEHLLRGEGDPNDPNHQHAVVGPT